MTQSPFSPHSFEPDHFETELRSFIRRATLDEPASLRSAIEYAAFSGGKRVRPRLLHAAAEALGVDFKSATSLAIGLELIHTYTLVHDDLPSMDNDDFRRGQPTVHRAFDEATALLAGDALLALGFEAVLETKDPAPLRVLTRVSGARGVIAGQLLEMGSVSEKRSTLETWLRVAELKTGALFEACFLLPASLVRAPGIAPQDFGTIGIDFGLAFQIADDLEDPEENATQDPKNIVHIEGRGAARSRALAVTARLRQKTQNLPHNGALLELLESLERKIRA